jgi:hypothetical protein
MQGAALKKISQCCEWAVKTKETPAKLRDERLSLSSGMDENQAIDHKMQSLKCADISHHYCRCLVNFGFEDNFQ